MEFIIQRLSAIYTVYHHYFHAFDDAAAFTPCFAIISPCHDFATLYCFMLVLLFMLLCCLLLIHASFFCHAAAALPPPDAYAAAIFAIPLRHIRYFTLMPPPSFRCRYKIAILIAIRFDA